MMFPIFAALTLSACAQQPTTIDASRTANDALYFFNDDITDGPVLDQVAALNASADELVKASTVNGALIGAAVGCGLTVISASNARNCLAGAAVGGVGGAVLGKQAGERDVARRVELVAANDVARDLNTATVQFQSIQRDLPGFLAAQEAELNSLTMQLVNGDITQDEHNLAVLKIEADRMDLAAALDLTARDARRVSDNLRTAARRGQTDLDWHIGVASTLADDVESTRSSFSLL